MVFRLRLRQLEVQGYVETLQIRSAGHPPNVKTHYVDTMTIVLRANKTEYPRLAPLTVGQS